MKDPKTGETIKQELDRVYNVVKPQITHNNPLLGVSDPIGETQFAKFQKHALTTIQDYKKEKKDLAELFEIPNGVLLKIAKNYYPTIQEAIASKAQQITEQFLNQKPTVDVPKKNPGETPADYMQRIGTR